VSEVTKEDLAEHGDRILEEVRRGFAGVHQRQDITNGRVQKVEVELGRQDERIKNIGREVFNRRASDRRPDREDQAKGGDQTRCQYRARDCGGRRGHLEVRRLGCAGGGSGEAMTLFDLAQRLVGEVAERPGAEHHPFIVWCHGATTLGESSDEVPWCSSFLNRLAWWLRLPRSKSAAARSWLDVGEAIALEEARAGYDIVVFGRGNDERSGHVALFAGVDEAGQVRVLGGNQGNAVTMASFPREKVLGVRRLRGREIVHG
jgi:uncharacterized protein (TIGR02594 family)